jgi:hypothetical protein
MSRLAKFLMILTLIVPVSGAVGDAYAGPAKPKPQPQSTGVGVIVLSADAHWPGKIFVNHDEWTLSDNVYTEDAAELARNVGTWFAKGRPGSFLVYSSNFGLTGQRLAETMKGAGHTWTVTTTLDFSLSTLLQYDGILLAGDEADNLVLIDYVRAGGNVYLAGGTGWGGPAAEAGRWNTFLNAFGLSLEPQYNEVAIGQYLPIKSPSPLFKNVHSLWQYFGNSVDKLDALNGDTEVLIQEQGKGLYATYGTHAIAVAVDIKPSTCSNSLNTQNRSIVRAAILGTPDLDVRTLDPASIRLFGVPPITSSIHDIAAPVRPYIGRTESSGCRIRPDKRPDLVLYFDSQAIVNAITAALGHEPKNGDVIAIVVTGTLKSQFGAHPILGEDLITIQNRWK